jgi:L-ascorbate metabolism protein UlaG (beta-lactamase superfamily)
MIKRLKKMFIIILCVCIVLLFGIILLFQHPIFGGNPKGERLERMKLSPNYKNGAFQNLNPTPSLSEGYNMTTILFNFLFKKFPNVRPDSILPSEKIDWNNINKEEDQIIWFGHSSYILFLSGKTYLIDPVLSLNASPVPGFNKAFAIQDTIQAASLPTIDVLIITHDHYDHLDYNTIKNIKDKVKKVICGLGVGAHFEKWGYATSNIVELDWWESINLDTQTSITATPARHFSGRTFKQNATLFCSYVLKSSKTNIFLGGDSGFDTHFKEIGMKFGPFDLAVLENGQYNDAWKYIHALPREMPQIIEDINAKKILPVHHSKYALAHHPWKEPLENIYKIQLENIQILTPKIGESIKLTSDFSTYTIWWDKI